MSGVSVSNSGEIHLSVINGTNSKSTSSRKVALGDCHRPYGTPCIHEHACTRCRFLRVDPAQLHRLEEMTQNAEARLSETRDRVWLGEVAGLEDSLKHYASADERQSDCRNFLAEAQ